MSEVWDTTFLNLAELYKQELYACADVDDFFRSLATLKIKTQCLCEAYGILVRRKLIEPIESISKEEKQKLWSEAKRVFGYDESVYATMKDGEKQRAEDLITMQKMCKAFYALGQYVQL